tara:strand:+ start:237 stop:419 length:183 start_codon:yes stop_codon:yes gene_type:complete
MIKCPACNELITPNCTTYKASSGFVDTENNFFEDKYVMIHQECFYNYLYDPFAKLEEELL